MIVPLKNDKSYGIIHTNNYFSFLGFSKNVDNNQIQKIDIFLDNELIDIINADKNLQDIDNLYNIEGFSFTYLLPNKYIDGQKHKISFRNHETKEELQNSPYTLIDKTHPKFNEMAFLNNLENPIDETIKDIYCINSIGFLATKENLEDKEFMSYIEEVSVRFSNIEIKKISFNYNLDFTTINSIKDIIKNCSIFITNPLVQLNYIDKIIMQQENKFQNVFVLPYNKQIINKQIKDIINLKLINCINNNLDTFNLTEKDIKNISSNHILMGRKIFEKLVPLEHIEEKELLNMIFKEFTLLNIEKALTNQKFIEVQKYINKSFKELCK